MTSEPRLTVAQRKPGRVGKSYICEADIWFATGHQVKCVIGRGPTSDAPDLDSWSLRLATSPNVALGGRALRRIQHALGLGHVPLRLMSTHETKCGRCIYRFLEDPAAIYVTN